MSFIDKLQKRAAEALEQKMSAISVSADIKQSRLDLCNSCEFLFTPTGTCKKCGCFVKAKTGIKSSSCPIGKWKSAE